MKILLLGVGMQGEAALHHLATSEGVEEVVAADLDPNRVERILEKRDYGPGIRARAVDAADPASLDEILEEEAPDAAIDLLPPAYLARVGRACVAHRVHLVNTMYVVPTLGELAEEAERKGLAILPELGMDPGIDLVLLGEAARRIDDPSEILTYGSGIPAPEAADNPLRYKVSWTFEGVLRTYHRPARLIRDGDEKRIPADQIFRPRHVHELELGCLGVLEAYPNGDVMDYLHQLRLDPVGLERAGRFTLRWPGHSAFWDVVARLGLLDDQPVWVEGRRVDRKAYLSAALEPRLRYGEGEADLGILRVEVAGSTPDGARREILQVVDRRDPDTGITAMGRLVGFSASIGAQMIVDGRIRKRGLLTPLRDVPYRPFVRALGERGIEVTERTGP